MLFEPLPALGDDDAAFQQQGSQLIDQRRSIGDEARPGAMKDLHVELFLALEIDETHRRPRRGFGDRLGVPLVVFLRLDVGLNVFGRHEPDVVTLFTEDPPEVMSAAAGLHRHDTRRQL